MHVLAGAVGVGGLADVGAAEEEDLGEAFVGVDAGGERGGVGDLEGDVSFPLRLQRGDIDDDAAAGIGGFAEADGDDIAGDAEVLDAAGEGKRVGGNDAEGAADVDKGLFVKGFGVDNGVKDVGKDFELIGDAEVVTVTGEAIADDGAPLMGAHLFPAKGFDHLILFRHLANPLIRFNPH